MNWGAFVIVATLLWPDGRLDTYTPSTRFDASACLAAATQINREWQTAAVHGFATCRAADK